MTQDVIEALKQSMLAIGSAQSGAGFLAVDDADALHSELTKRGFTIVPTVTDEKVREVKPCNGTGKKV